MVVVVETKRPSSMRARLREIASRSHFAYELLIAPWPPYAGFLMVSGLVSGLTPLLQIKLISGLIDALTRQAGVVSTRPPASLAQSLSPYLPWLLLLIGMRVIDWLISTDALRQYLAAELNERVRERFERRFYQKALALRLEWFESTAYYDALQRARRAMEPGAVADYLAGMQRLVSLALGCIAILWAVGRVHWLIPLVLLPGSLALVDAQLRGERAMIGVRFDLTRLQRKRDYWRRLLTERAPAAEVRLFGLGEHMVSAWRGLTDQMLGEMSVARRRSVRRWNRILAGNTVIYGGVILALLLAAARGAISAGSLVALIYVIQDYPTDIHNLSWWTGRFLKFFTELQYVARFLSLEREEPTTGLPAPALTAGGIQLEEVSFTYPGSERPALCGISLQLRPGERVALVGENGAGKSTLVKLLLGLYQPSPSGRISAAGVDLGSIAPSSWRAKVAAVLQEFGRYSLTARENIGLGRLEKLEELPAIEAAARASSAAEVIAGLPDGYETLLGKEFEGGQDLSQGQWQKLAIARAYLRGAELLILDEPASALDALAEREIYRQFLALSTGKTVLLISHRLGSARLADRILFLANGRIVEEGTHEALMATGGAYSELYALQAAWYQGREAEEAVVPNA
jgi:ATP-binding cassette subfamily B protein